VRHACQAADCAFACTHVVMIASSSEQCLRGFCAAVRCAWRGQRRSLTPQQSVRCARPGGGAIWDESLVRPLSRAHCQGRGDESGLLFVSSSLICGSAQCTSLAYNLQLPALAVYMLLGSLQMALWLQIERIIPLHQAILHVLQDCTRASLLGCNLPVQGG